MTRSGIFNTQVNTLFTVRLSDERIYHIASDGFHESCILPNYFKREGESNGLGSYKSGIETKDAGKKLKMLTIVCEIGSDVQIGYTDDVNTCK